MMTVGVAIDDWKLPLFQTELDKEGYKYSKHNALTPNTLLLKVETEAVGKLKSIIKRLESSFYRNKGE